VRQANFLFASAMAMCKKVLSLPHHFMFINSWKIKVVAGRSRKKKIKIILRNVNNSRAESKYTLHF
jgi:hypothetical protein